MSGRHEWPNHDPIAELGAKTLQLPSLYNQLVSENIGETAIIDRDAPDAVGTEEMDMPPALVDALHPAYRFVNNNPVSSVDSLGEDIYLQTGNDSGNPINDRIHQSICVDTWSGSYGCCGHKTGKACFSFGANGKWRIPIPSGTWLGWSEFNAGGPMVGEIYSADDTGTVVNTIKTTCKQDMMFLIYMNARLGSIDTYSVGRHNCRRYSQYEFRDAPSHMGPP